MWVCIEGGEGYLILVRICYICSSETSENFFRLHNITSHRVMLFITPALRKAKEKFIMFPI